MYYFYVLLSEKDNKFYFGSTSDLKRRYAEHRAGLVRSTKSRLPLEIVYYEAYNRHELAVRREQTVKRSGTARDALKKRIMEP